MKPQIFFDCEYIFEYRVIYWFADLAVVVGWYSVGTEGSRVKYRYKCTSS